MVGVAFNYGLSKYPPYRYLGPFAKKRGLAACNSWSLQQFSVAQPHTHTRRMSRIAITI